MVDKTLAAAYNRFAFQLFAELAGRQPGENLFISPVSIAFALAMTWNGAAGETQRAIAKTLELAGLDHEAINRGSAALMRSLASIDPQVTLAVGNSLWAREGVRFAPAFLERNREYYQAELATLDFADPQAPAAINRWVRKRTGGKIERIVDQIDDSAILFLVNAIYFKGSWSRKFDERQTEAGTFTLPGGRQKRHPMMRQSGEYRYLEGNGFQAVSLPYGGGDLSMYVFLPDRRSDLAGFYKALDARNWDGWMRRFDRTDGTIVLPRFKLEYEQTLNEPLKRLGMAVAFDPRRADFSNMVEDRAARLCVDEVKHKTFVEVNEQGTEAAAVTSVGVALASFMPKQPFQMRVDRPFFCAIRDDRTGALLFVGAIVDP